MPLSQRVRSPHWPTLRLIVAAQALLDSGMSVITSLQVVEDEDPESLLAPRVGGVGWAVATKIEQTLVSRLQEHVATASDDEMEQVNVALRASLDL
jgi:hypothetical protein